MHMICLGILQYLELGHLVNQDTDLTHMSGLEQFYCNWFFALCSEIVLLSKTYCLKWNATVLET